jgi:hypothetical protein
MADCVTRLLLPSSFAILAGLIHHISQPEKKQGSKNQSDYDPLV